MKFTALDFIRESNRIERIHREPTTSEVVEYQRFMALPEITVKEMEAFVQVYQPGAMLRDRSGLNVQVGNYFPPLGGVHIKTRLEDILSDATWRHPYIIHEHYERLHPFTDGNGRSGRMLWAWQMNKLFGKASLDLGFLHTHYYQSLEQGRL